MASKEDEGGCVTLTWEIQNFSILLPLEERSWCRTPFWRTEHSGKSVCRRLSICLYSSNIHFYISSAKECSHLDRCEVSLIPPCMEVPLQLNYRGSDFWDYIVESDVVFGDKRQSILPDDTLTLHCKMWEKTMKTREFRINSVLHSFSYLWNIENFNPHDVYRKYIQEEKFVFKVCLQSKSEKGTHKFLFGEVSSIDSYVLPLNFKLYDKAGGLRVIEEINDNTCNTKIYEIEIGLNNTRLDLQLESIFAVHEVCLDKFKLISPPLYENVSEAVSGALCNDFLLIYRDKLFSDATLNAEGKTFHVHRSILSARSPVFRAMFEKHEMSEGRSGAVDIDDVDSETVDRMLVYLYGDSLKSVHKWEEASALYYAADKYDIQPLKQKLANGLKEGLTVDNACEALLLADRHSDDHLMKCIVDFIRQNEEVISSKKWDCLQNNNPLLVAKILREMYLKIKKN